MCGIGGIIDFHSGTADDARLVRLMMSRLEHRGPDGDGFWSGDFAHLGHRRLSIIDLAGGWQPIFNEDESVVTVFNGEIYNYRDLRSELERRGHRFRTQSDTDVIVHGYEEWGDQVVERLRGMFTFAVCDLPRRRVLLARDRYGVKPLYLYESPGGRLLFASEIKALFADASVPRRLNPARLAEYLAFRSVAGDETLFDRITELAPGSTLAIDASGSRRKIYWRPRAHRAGDADSSAEPGDPTESGRELLRDAVRSRLVSDVELGTITSGGLDSSLVSAAAAEIAGRRIDTFCVGFRDAAYDERPFARQVADAIGSRHHDIVVTPEQIDEELDRLTWAHDEPLTHPNSVPMHLIFRYAKEDAGVTVLLSGEGADEVFGGYERYAVLLRRDRLRGRLPGASSLAPLLPGVGKLKTLKKVLGADYPLASSAFTAPAEVRRLVAGECISTARRELWGGGSRAGVDDLFVYDQQTYLAPLLQRQDRMSMAAGLEAREPFLDHHLTEWANDLPAEVKLAGGVRKALLKSIARRWLPASIIDRRKVGFEMPLGAWLRRGGALAGRVDGLREAGSFVASALDHAQVRRTIDEHDAGRADHADLLWTLVALETWARVFLGSEVGAARLPGALTGRVLAPSR